MTSVLKIWAATSTWHGQRTYKATADLAVRHLTTVPACCITRRKGKQIQYWHYQLNHLLRREVALRSTAPLTTYINPQFPRCHFRLAQRYVYSFFKLCFQCHEQDWVFPTHIVCAQHSPAWAKMLEGTRELRPWGQEQMPAASWRWVWWSSSHSLNKKLLQGDAGVICCKKTQLHMLFLGKDKHSFTCA